MLAQFPPSCSGRTRATVRGGHADSSAWTSPGGSSSTLQRMSTEAAARSPSSCPASPSATSRRNGETASASGKSPRAQTSEALLRRSSRGIV
ncbi:hypothetical protein HPB50_028696 [Hyalomma asiaticum]|nr:hypothetical protein HPB50_028696 [Hyalomma asiaticum]